MFQTLSRDIYFDLMARALFNLSRTIELLKIKEIIIYEFTRYDTLALHTQKIIN